MPSRTELANAIRFLSMDAVQKAKSGHPGAPMGMADMAEVLWNDFLNHNPANPKWVNRDRVVLSNGHGSMLIYSLLHLSGYDLPIEEIQNFRQLGSKTAGHPEYGVTPGVETTTGPLGQGIANAVGMAMAEKLMAEEFNQDGLEIMNHFTYVFMGDGCMMEGISHEACSLAGTLGLGKLICLYDDNSISIDGRVDDWFADNTPKRFAAYNWHVIPDVDGHNPEAVKKALAQARAVTDKPSLICCKTIIGKGAPTKCNSSGCHGSPLGDEEIAATRQALGWEYEPFDIPTEIYEAWDARSKGSALETAWNNVFSAYKDKHPELAAEFERRMNGELPAGFAAAAETYIRKAAKEAKDMATRKSGQAALAAYSPMLPELMGGSADLTGSNGTVWEGTKSLSPENWDANYIHYGVREFAMAAVCTGMTLHGGYIPFAGTFLVFSDYSRNALRMQALMGLRCVHILTHDSIGVGEDGPTHQPVEHVPSLRMIPNMRVWRPCDTVESAVAWKAAVEHTSGPSCLVMSRQNLAFQQRDDATVANVAKGGYVLKDCEGTPDMIVLSTGSEVAPTVEAVKLLEAKGKKIRVVSMPCVEVFEAQDQEYKDSVLLPDVTLRAAVEAAAPTTWHKYVGRCGAIVAMTTFGESAPGNALFDHFGFTPEKIAASLEAVL